MPRGPKGEKRPADVIGNAVHVVQLREAAQEPKGPFACDAGGYQRHALVHDRSGDNGGRDSCEARQTRPL